MKCKIIMEEYQRKHIEHNLMKMVFKIAMLFYKTRLSFWLQKSAELQRLWLIEKVKSIYATSTTSCVLLATKYLSRHERLDTRAEGIKLFLDFHHFSCLNQCFYMCRFGKYLNGTPCFCQKSENLLQRLSFLL